MPNNCTRLSDSTHHLPEGAVSFSLLWETLSQHEMFLRRLKYLVRTVPDDEFGESHVFIGELTNAAKDEYTSFCEQAKAEKATFGGNDVHVVKEVC